MPHSYQLQDSVNKPSSVQFELVEGCSRICDFCGIVAIRDRPGNYKFADNFVIGAAASQIAGFCPGARIEFAMHGEPLMHPRYIDAFKTFRAYLPRTQMQVTTNGVIFRGKADMRTKVEQIFDAGLDFILLDTYYPERDELRDKAFSLREHGIDVLDFYDDMAPKGESPWKNHRRKLNRTVVLMDDLSARDGEVASRKILNHAGNNATKLALQGPLQKTCVNPFREISICYNGNVNICCMDWRHEFTMGNVLREDLADIWAGALFQAARAHLQNKDRNFRPCDRCDKGSGARASLLPKYSMPTARQRSILPRRGLLEIIR